MDNRYTIYTIKTE